MIASSQHPVGNTQSLDVLSFAVIPRCSSAKWVLARESSVGNWRYVTDPACLILGDKVFMVQFEWVGAARSCVSHLPITIV